MDETPCPYVTGTVTRYCTLTPFTLTDAEREAIAAAECAYSARSERGVGLEKDSPNDCAMIAATLRGLLDRTDRT